MLLTCSECLKCLQFWPFSHSGDDGPFATHSVSYLFIMFKSPVSRIISASSIGGLADLCKTRKGAADSCAWKLVTHSSPDRRIVGDIGAFTSDDWRLGDMCSFSVILLLLYVHCLAALRKQKQKSRLHLGCIETETPTIDRPPVGNANPPLWPCPPSNAGKVSHIGFLSFST